MFNLFFIAETIGTTVGQLVETLTVSEYEHWVAYIKLKDERSRQEVTRGTRR